jgi:hypothetical protein
MSKNLYKPNLIVIGTQKCGTTAIHYYLSQHPEIFEAKKEIKFFNCDQNYSKGINFYLENFKKNSLKSNGKFFFDVSPGYLVNSKPSERIYNFDPKIKLIAILRDPSERAFSEWNMYIPKSHENGNWFFSDEIITS